MAVNSTSTREFSIGDIVRMSYQQAGLRHLAETPDSDESLFAQDKLEIITDQLVTEGGFVRQVDLYELTTVASTSEYTLPANMLDLIDTAMYLDPGSTTGETSLRKISRDQWVRLGNKTTTGRPNLYYSHRSGSVLTVRLWPVPDEAGTITFQYQKLAADTNDDTKSLEAGRHWTDYFVWRLAHDLATAGGLDIQRCSYLWKRAERALEKAKDYSNEAVVDQMYVSHRTNWTEGY